MRQACQHIVGNKQPHLSVYIANRRDPSRTLSLRNAFVRAMNRRFRRLRGLIWKSIVEEDVFGLRETGASSIVTYQTPGRRAFAFPRDSRKVSSFMRWLQGQVDAGILDVREISQVGESVESAWQNKYIYDSYKRGVARARYQMRMEGFEVPPLEATGGIAASMSTPFHIDRVGLLFTRAFNELKGITAAMDQQISRVLASGLAEGQHPRTIAKALNATISGKGKTLKIKDTLGRVIPAERRAQMLARTETIRAHAEGQLQEFKNWRVEGVHVMAEWETSGNACPECAAREGDILTIEEATNVIPYHPNCRCIWIPKKVDEPVPHVKGEELPENTYNNYNTAKKKVKEYASQPKTLTDAQRTVQYSAQSGDLNNALRGRMSMSQGAQIYDYNVTFTQWANSVTSFLTKAPKFAGTSYRGMGWFDSSGYRKFYKSIKDGIYTDKAFISSSQTIKAAKDLNPVVGIGGESGGAVIIKIQGRTGVAIEDISFFKDQKEILFNRKTRFRIIEINKGKYGPKIDEIVVEEITG